MSTKRESEEANGIELKKRKVLDTLSESGPLTQKDVVYFQKEAIFRQLQKYRSEVKVIKGEYALLETEFDSLTSSSILLSQWVDQFLEFVTGVSTQKDDVSDLDFFLSIPSSVTDESLISTLNSKKEKFVSLVQRFGGALSADAKNSVASINKELHNVSAKYDALKIQNKVLNKKHAKLLEDFKELSNEFERSTSKTLARVLKPKEEHTEDEVKPESRSNSVKGETTVGPMQVDENQLEALTAQIAEQQAIITAQKNTISENIEKFSKLSSSINVQVDTDEIVRNSDKYQQLQKQKDDLQSKQLELVQKIELLENDLKESNDNSTQQKKALENFNSEKNNLMKELAETKEKEERLRNQRDLYLTEIDVLKQKNNWKVMNDLKELVTAQEKQISSLSLESQLNNIVPSDATDLEQLQKKNALLLKEISELEMAFQQLQSVRVPKILSAVEEEKRKKELDVAKIKVDSKYRMLMEGEKYQQVTRDKLETSFKMLKTNFDKLESSQQEYKVKIDALNTELTELKTLLAKKELELKEYRIKITNLEERLKLETTQAKKITQDFAVLKDEHESLLITDASKSSENAQLKSKLSSQEKLIQRFKQTGSLEDSSEIDNFRSLIYCSLCSKNWKDTAIKTCGHVFCESCAKERLAARMRKCPSCNKQFSSNDLLTIHL